jgi:hypothetical protein
MNKGAPTCVWVLAVGFVVAGCTASASLGPAPSAATPAAAAVAAPAPPVSRPTTEEGCKACNGLWGAHGVSQTPSCNCRTTDGGRRCRDGAECQGLCLAAEEPEREIVEAGPPARGHFIGRCSETRAVFGCYRSIDRGAADRGPVPLTDPPAQLCAD